MDDAADEIESELVDLTGLSLAEIPPLGNESVLSNALQRVYAESKKPEEPIAGFQNRIVPPDVDFTDYV